MKYYRENRDNKKRYSTSQAKIDKCIMGYLARSIKSNFDSKIGCIYKDNLTFTIQEFKQYFENLFTLEMNWNNYGTYWEIDHIIPKKFFSFDSVDNKEFKICWSLMNLRPLTIEENRARPRDLGSDVPEELKQQILGQKLYNDIMGVENREEYENV